jgi:hypothetical protein
MIRKFVVASPELSGIVANVVDSGDDMTFQVEIKRGENLLASNYWLYYDEVWEFVVDEFDKLETK